MSAGVLNALFDLIAAPETGEAPTLVPVRMVRVAHDGRPGIHHAVRVPDGVHLRVGQRVIFEVPGDAAVGRVEGEPYMVLPTGGDPESLPRIRPLSAEETEALLTAHGRKEAEAFAAFRERVAALRLSMKPVHVELSVATSRYNLYFWAEHRVDFRPLLADLRKRINGRIELLQLGAHDAARHIGGIGRCQREFCNRVIPEYPAVSPKHARTQGLSPNPQKHLGTCNRLMMCLQHEQAQYVEARKGLPKEGKSVDTPIGRAVIKELDILRARVKVRAESGEWGTFALSELSRDGKPLAEANPSDETIDRDGDDDELGRFDEVAEEELPPELRPPKRGPLGPTRDDAPAAAPVQPAPREAAPASARPPRVEAKPERGDRRPERKPDPRPERGERRPDPKSAPRAERGERRPERAPQPQPQARPARPSPPVPRGDAPPPSAIDPTVDADDDDNGLDEDGPDEASDGPPEGGAPRKRRRRRRRGGGGSKPSNPQT
jgi:cell fate regulator YaaT (PSP1 superfamily)